RRGGGGRRRSRRRRPAGRAGVPAVMLTDEQSAFQESVRGFVKRECGREQMRQSVAAGHHDEKVWKKLAENGLLGVAIAPEYGGSGGDIVDLCLALELL